MSASTKQFLKECVRVFAFAFAGAFLPAISGVWVAPNFDAAKAVAVSALIASVATAAKAVLDFLTKGVSPAPSVGVLPESVK